MAMSRDDYAEIAEAVAEAKRAARYNLPDEDKETAMVVLEIVTRELSTACARRRKTGAGAFNRQKFVKACGFEEA